MFVNILRVVLGVISVLALLVWEHRRQPETRRFTWAVSNVLNEHDRFVDDVTQYLRRFDAVRKQLQAGDVVGYLADEPVRIQDVDFLLFTIDGQDQARHPTQAYFLAQYAMAPVLVDRENVHPRRIENRRAGVSLAHREDP